MTGQSPTARTLSLCRKNGWAVDVAETHNAFSNKKKDLFGFIDIVACISPGDEEFNGGFGILGIQATSYSNISARVKKILEHCSVNAQAWLQSGGKIEVWGWKRFKTKRQSGRYWEAVKRNITMDMFQE